jgi:RsiW-degrading membrane proteinase PrsW (M82 family)
MLSVTCSCGKTVFGSEVMAGQEVQCFKCHGMVTLPGGAPKVAAAKAFEAGSAASAWALAAVASATRPEEPAPIPLAVPVPSRARDSLYWVLLLALLPLVSVIFHEKDASPLQRLRKALAADPELKAKVEILMDSPEATLDKLLSLFPGGRLDSLAHLPRQTDRHWVYAGWSGAAFFILVGLWMASGCVPAWKLLLAALFTGTFGIACLFLFHDFIGHDKQLTLEAEHGFVVNLIGFTLIVGLGEELCKALPVIFYLRTDKAPTLRGACFWGMASGVGFGLSEAISYATKQYNGIAPADIYLIRYISCVALHAVWSASVGITLFQCRRLVTQVVNAIVYLGKLDRGELAWAIARVLGVAMLLHGAYDALLTQDQVIPALLVALVSFGWLGWQIETAREQELAANAALEPAPA